MDSFLVLPAIDLRDGKCVRLYQGDYNQTTVFSDNPVEVANRWKEEGAKFLHLVDLDGAAQGKPRNLPSIEAIVKSTAMLVEVGGGIRTLETIELLLQAGVNRVILGTVAVENPELVKEACHRYGEAIVVGVDARDGFVATKGWLEASTVSAAEMIERMGELGVRRFIYTDISRDGTLTEPNYASIERLIALTKYPLIASGGVAKVSHVARLKELGAEGVIIGKALYTGDVELREALAVC